MSTFKCKMCGGTLEIQPGQTVAECEYCGTQQTLPKLDDDRRANLYDRANHFRRNNEFDKAMGIYEKILNEDNTDAESYWSLVLCRYGIEYVEDPATHKRVPTVNRAQYTSIFDDDNYKSALQYADSYQRGIYEAEANAINEIQKGILAISQKEEPFDVFICYKETDNNGRRTPDSVLANDLYHQLTLEGFKVFFSRITLEDKLGSAYEPYIFAALNSAKVMVVLGTKPEYFNAVWVKNEWSRYLSLIRQGQKKVLVPAYKDMDPYDLPEEFSHLQAQDMGKLGFMQDLIRGIKKITQMDEPKTVVKETVVEKFTAANVSGSNIDALLERGNMALEDGEWTKADGFFEEVLNQDAKNANAYLGKALAQANCATLDELVDKKCTQYAKVQTETLSLSPDTAHIQDAVQKYTVPNYVAEASIESLYTFDLSYQSGVPHRKQEYTTIQHWWKNHKLLSRAEQFASGAVLQELQDAKNKLFTHFEAQIKSAEDEEHSAINSLRTAYKEHLKQADRNAEAQYQEGITKKDEYYQSLVKIAESSTDVSELNRTASNFECLGDYRESKAFAQQCRSRAEAEIARKHKIHAAKIKKYSMISGIIAVIVAIAVMVMTKVIIPNKKYNQAVAQMDAGYTFGAAKSFYNLGDYSDAREQANTLWKQIIQRSSISGRFHTVGLKSDGTVVAVGVNDDGQYNVDDWTDIVSVTAGYYHTVGLKTDGTVVAVGWNGDGQCDVETWTDIVSVAAGYDYTVGLKADGTVVTVGDNTHGQCDVDDWTGIVAIKAGEWHTVGLKADGTVVAVGDNTHGQCDVDDWTDIVSVAAGYNYTVGLKSDGTVVAVGDNTYGQCDVGAWTDIVALAAGRSHTVGLKSDGTVVAVGNNDYGQCDVETWTGIKVSK